jgi:hypothetical protein
MRRIDSPVHNPRRALVIVLVVLAVVVAGGIALIRLTAADHYTRAEYVADCSRHGTSARSCDCEYDALVQAFGRKEMDATEHATADERRRAPAIAIAYVC